MYQAASAMGRGDSGWHPRDDGSMPETAGRAGRPASATTETETFSSPAKEERP